MSALTADITLDALIRGYRERADGVASMRERVETAFARVSPSDLRDADLAEFLALLYVAVRSSRPRRVVQTGTFVGASALAIGFGLEDNGEGELYSIDPEPPEYFGVREPVAVARAAVAAAGLADRVQLVHGYSTTPWDGGRMELPLAPLWRLTAVPAPYDMLVVDGDHTYEGCLFDLVYGGAGLAEDGPRLVIVHDYLGIPEVKRAVRTWLDGRAAETRIVPSRCGIALIRLVEGSKPKGGSSWQPPTSRRPTPSRLG